MGSPECLRQFGEPKIPADLERHKAVVFTYGGVPRSKAERTAGLMSRARPKPARAKPPELAPETTVDEAIAIIQRNFLRQFLGNMPALRVGRRRQGGSSDARRRAQAAVGARLVQPSLPRQ